jgi:hypothetical protein
MEISVKTLMVSQTEAVSLLSRIAPCFQETFIQRVTLSWCSSHPQGKEFKLRISRWFTNLFFSPSSRSSELDFGIPEQLKSIYLGRFPGCQGTRRIQ